MAPYQEKFPVGSDIRIAPLEELEKFKREWKFHDPLQAVQLAFSDKVCRAEKIGFYHGGDVLYWLLDVPGTWHEQCLRQADLRK